MAVLLLQVDWTDKDGVTTSFTDIESCIVSMKSDATANTAKIVLKNSLDRLKTGFAQPFNSYVGDTNNIKFNEGDSIKVYSAFIDDWRAIDTSVNSKDLIMSAEISELAIKGSKGSSKITLSCVDKTYAILNRVWTFPYIASMNMNAPEIIQDVVRNVTDDIDSDNSSFDDSGNNLSNGKYAVDARLVSTGTASLPAFIEDTRIDGSVFPDLAKSMVAKPAYTWVKELSTINSTNDFEGSDDEDAPTQNRNMLFYIDELNRFHWYYPRDNVTTPLNGDITSSVTTIPLTATDGLPDVGSVLIGTERIEYIGLSGNSLTNCTRAARDTTAASHSDGDIVRTSIQITEGDSSTGHVVNSFNLSKKVFDVVNYVIFSCGTDLSGNGITYFFFDETTKSKELKDTYKPYTDISIELWDSEINAGNLIRDNTQTDFTYAENGNYYKADTYGFTTTWGVDTTGFSDSDYNDAFRTESIRLGTIKAQQLTSNRAGARWTGSMENVFRKYVAGDLIEFTSTRAGMNQQSLRVKQVKYNFTKSGAKCTLSVEEDEPKKGEI